MKIPKLLLLIFAVFFFKTLYAPEIGRGNLDETTYHDCWKPKFGHLDIEDKIPKQNPNLSTI